MAGVRLRGMLAGRRFRVELTEAQARLAQQTADACRVVWNTGLEQRRVYRHRGAWINYEQQAHELVDAKKEHTWLSAAGMARSTCGGARRAGGYRRFGSRKVLRWKWRS